MMLTAISVIFLLELKSMGTNKVGNVIYKYANNFSNLRFVTQIYTINVCIAMYMLKWSACQKFTCQNFSFPVVTISLTKLKV